MGTDVGSVIGQHRNRAKWLRNREVMDAAFAKNGGKSGRMQRAIMSQARRFEKMEAVLEQKTSSSAAGTRAFASTHQCVFYPTPTRPSTRRLNFLFLFLSLSRRVSVCT